MKRPLVAAGPLALAACALLAACTSGSSSSPAPSPSPSPSTPVSAAPSTSPSTARSSGPIAAGPTRYANGSCPYLDDATAMQISGERLSGSRLLTSGGKTIGCQFLPISDDPLATSENLPTGPVAQISVQRYTDATTAHNAMVLQTRKDPAAFQNPISGADEAISYLTTFNPPDGARDNAFVFRKGTTVVTIKLAQTNASLSAQHLGEAVVGKF